MKSLVYNCMSDKQVAGSDFNTFILTQKTKKDKKDINKAIEQAQDYIDKLSKLVLRVANQ